MTETQAEYKVNPTNAHPTRNETQPIRSYATIEIRGTGNTPNTTIIVKEIDDDGLCLVTFWIDNNVGGEPFSFKTRILDGIGYNALSQVILAVRNKINNEQINRGETK